MLCMKLSNIALWMQRGQGRLRVHPSALRSAASGAHCEAVAGNPERAEITTITQIDPRATCRCG